MVIIEVQRIKMKTIISKVADCLYNITAGAILISIFQNEKNSYLVSVVGFLCATFMAWIANRLEK